MGFARSAGPGDGGRSIPKWWRGASWSQEGWLEQPLALLWLLPRRRASPQLPFLVLLRVDSRPQSAKIRGPLLSSRSKHLTKQCVSAAGVGRKPDDHGPLRNED